MKLASYLKDEHDQLALLENNLLYDTDLLHIELPSSMAMFLNFWNDNYALALKIQQAIIDNRIGKEKGFNADDANFLAPIPFPSSFRKGIETQPGFYFANHHAVQGSGAVMCMPDNFDGLSFEIEVAIVVSKLGRNIPAEEADEYIAGIMLLNSFSSGKRKNFATAAGPYLVTTEELEAHETATENQTYKTWNLTISCSVNSEKVIDANDNIYTFAELIEQASYGATLYPGDIISSHVVITGNVQLKEGDTIEIASEALGTLINTIEKEETEVSTTEE